MTVFAYIARKKDGTWSGVCAANANMGSVADFMSRHILAGCEILSVETREAYRAMIERQAPWGDGPKAERKE